MSARQPDTRILAPAQAALLAAVQDRLIPREGEFPGAGEAGGVSVLDSYLLARLELRRPIFAALRAIEEAAEQLFGHQYPAAEQLFLALTGEQQDVVLRAAEAAQPTFFRELVRQTYNTYYTNPRIHALLGEGSGPPQPHGYPSPPPLDESLLERVKRRGKLWREA
jgi:hypothetical protein